jgi:hypothetical protein
MPCSALTGAGGRRRSSGRVRSWACGLCTLENAAGAKLCGACGARKPEGQAAPPSLATGVLAGQQQVGRLATDGSPCI